MWFQCEFFIYNNAQDFFFDLFYHLAVYCEFSFEAFFVFEYKDPCLLYDDVYPPFLAPLHYYI